MESIAYMDTPAGRLGIVAENGAITQLFFAKDPGTDQLGPDTSLLKRAAAQLDEYFAGQRRAFELPLAPKGTEFQQQVWQALLTIPYGQTRSYKQIAEQTGRAKACRAVGLANNRNPISIVIPCHRVVGSNGSLVGYGGGLPVKQRLLDLEAQGGVL